MERRLRWGDDFKEERPQVPPLSIPEGLPPQFARYLEGALAYSEACHLLTSALALPLRGSQFGLGGGRTNAGRVGRNGARAL